MCITSSQWLKPKVTTNDEAAQQLEQGKMGLKVLMCSENVPPQVNGIARRIGMYAEGLKKLGCDVDLLHPESGINKVLSHINPWNFTANMMIILPSHVLKLVFTPYDVVHVVMPANLSGMWLLCAFKLARCFRKEKKPALVVSWHCNLIDYIEHFSARCTYHLGQSFIFRLFGMLPRISDRILTPTRSTDPKVVELWGNATSGNPRAGVCYTGVNKNEFSVASKDTECGKQWLARKGNFLQATGRKFLLVCVGRLSPEKGVDELIRVMPLLQDCALWLVGDGPFRPEFERLVNDLGVPVDFLGYQRGEDLHATYAVGDLFVCPSLTETFGQTVNEALASQVRIALPDVPVFAEAYHDTMPTDAFWEPLDRTSMVAAIRKQLERHVLGDPTGVPDVSKLRSWDDACEALLGEYNAAAKDRRHLFGVLESLWFPFWLIFTMFVATTFFIFSQIRAAFGGSVRSFFRSVIEDITACWPKDGERNSNGRFWKARTI